MSEDELPPNIFDDTIDEDFYRGNQYFQFDFNEFDTKLNSSDDQFFNHSSPNFDISELTSSLYTTDSASDMELSTNHIVSSNPKIDSTSIFSPKINKHTKSKNIVKLTPKGREFKRLISLELLNDPNKPVDKRIVKELHNVCCNFNKSLKPCSRKQFRSFGYYYNEHSSEYFELKTTLRTLRDHGIITYPESN